MTHKIIRFFKDYSLSALFLTIIVFTIVYHLNRSNKLKEARQKNPVFLVGKVISVNALGKSGRLYQYSFWLSGINYQGHVCCEGKYPTNLIGKPIIITYERGNPGNHQALFNEYDFPIYRLTFPDSIRNLYLFGKP